MKQKYTLAPVLLAVALLAGGILGCKKSGPDAADAKKANGQNVTVAVETVTPQEFDETMQVTGTLTSPDDVTVPAEEGGKLVEWVVPRGAHVKKGQVIARFDDALLRAGFEAANSQYQMAQLTYDKQLKVYEAQAVSEWQIRSLEYQRNAAKAQADIARTRLEKMQIKSPVDGIVNQRFIDEGEMIGPGMPIAQVVAAHRLKLVAGVPEKYAGTFRMGDPVRFTVTAYPGEQFQGKISFIGAAVSKDNRTLPVEATVTSGLGRLKPDMIAAMQVRLGSRNGVIVVKSDYLQQIDRGEFVVFVARDGVAEQRRVTVAAQNGGRALITDGLKAGEQIITLGFQNVANGQKITVANGR
jgi:membrane fusion protein, multidrug efflux system